MHDLVKFTITDLQARVADDFRIVWEGKELNPGPLNIELDRTAGGRNSGLLDYSSCQARAEFHVLLTFPEFANALDELGVAPELTQPVSAVIRSEGDILEDHSFILSGPCNLGEHALLGADETSASVMPGT